MTTLGESTMGEHEHPKSRPPLTTLILLTMASCFIASLLTMVSMYYNRAHGGHESLPDGHCRNSGGGSKTGSRLSPSTRKVRGLAIIAGLYDASIMPPSYGHDDDHFSPGR